MATWIQAAAVPGKTSKSVLTWRVRPSHAKVRATIQRRGKTGNPVGIGGGSESAGHQTQRRGLRTTVTDSPKLFSIQVAVLP